MFLRRRSLLHVVSRSGLCKEQAVGTNPKEQNFSEWKGLLAQTCNFLTNLREGKVHDARNYLAIS